MKSGRKLTDAVDFGNLFAIGQTLFVLDLDCYKGILIGGNDVVIDRLSVECVSAFTPRDERLCALPDERKREERISTPTIEW